MRINPRAEVWVGGGLALVAILVQPGVALASALGWKLTRTQEADLLVLTLACIAVAVLMVLHGFGLFGWISRIRLQSPIALAPVGKTSVSPVVRAPALALPNPSTAPKPKSARVYADVSTAKLVELAKTPNLTTAQTAALIEPYVNMWLAIEGDVDNVNPPNQVVVREGDAASSRLTCTYFSGGFNPRSLQKGEHIRLIGLISGVTLGMVQLQECELSKAGGPGG